MSDRCTLSVVRRLPVLIRSWTCFGLLAVGCPSLACGQSDPAQLESQVQEWIDQLDAASRRRRVEAERQLIEAGPGALAFIPESVPGQSPEASERLQRVRATLLSRRTDKEAEDLGSPIRLGDAATLADALEAISRDSGVEFDYMGDLSVPVRSVSTPLPFWHAIDLVLDQTDLDINFYGGAEGTLLLVPRRDDRPSRVDSAAYVEGFRIEPKRITATRNLGQPDLNGLSVGIEISWIPTFTPIGLTIPVAQISGKLDDDDDVQPQSTADTIDVATPPGIAFTECYLPFQLPAGRPKTIVSIAGEIRVLIPGKRQTFRLQLSELNQPKTIDSMTVQIEQLRENAPLHEVLVGVELKNAGRSLESHRHWVLENNAYVSLKDGSRSDNLGFHTYRQTPSGVGISYLFDLGEAADESTFVYESPTAVVPRNIPFVIHDIPLP